MNPLVRMVCGGCLRSVDVRLDETGRPLHRCPYCGGVVDSEADDGETRTTAHAPRSELAEAVPSDSISAEWGEMWARGSLGSLGRFYLRERLGDGGFGQVYLAFDPRLDRNVALKVLKQPNPSERVMERFFREARAAARLDHPNIVRVYDAGVNDGRCWVVFEHVSGRPLDWYRDQHRLDPPTAARVLRDLADAVDHAHRQGVFHRDIKPTNVLIDDHGRPRLIDFGLARRADLDSSLTRDGAVVGTPAYMSPEQALGFSRQVDERSDVFSLGVILFEMLTGERPYGALSQSTATAEHIPPAGRPDRKLTPSARGINGAVPSGLDRICSRAIARDPKHRYPTARALTDDLDQWLLQHRGVRAKLSFAVSTILLGAAAALLLLIGIPSALFPWGERARNQSPIESAAGPVAPAGSSRTDETDRLISLAELKAPRRLRKPASSTPALVGNLHRRVYHRPECETVKSMNDSNRIDLEDAEEAASQGLRPCLRCQPPVSASAGEEAGSAGPDEEG
jgi:serine/threonine protein kinase